MFLAPTWSPYFGPKNGYSGCTRQQAWPKNGHEKRTQKQALKDMFEKKSAHTSTKNRAHLGTKPLLKRRPLMVPRGAVPDKT